MLINKIVFEEFVEANTCFSWMQIAKPNIFLTQKRNQTWYAKKEKTSTDGWLNVAENCEEKTRNDILGHCFF